MPKCKHCGAILTKENIRKSWILAGKMKGYKFRIDLYDCPNCGKTMRTGTRI